MVVYRRFGEYDDMASKFLPRERAGPVTHPSHLILARQEKIVKGGDVPRRLHPGSEGLAEMKGVRRDGMFAHGPQGFCHSTR